MARSQLARLPEARQGEVRATLEQLEAARRRREREVLGMYNSGAGNIPTYTPGRGLVYPQ